MSNLSNSTIKTSIFPENGRFSIEILTQGSSVLLENACLGVRYRYRGRTYRHLYDHWSVYLEDQFESKDDHLGKLHQHSLLIDPGRTWDFLPAYFCFVGKISISDLEITHPQ